jgi:hypothetical protein
MKPSIKRKNFYIDEAKLYRAKRILKAKTETETVSKALDLVVFRKEIVSSIRKAAKSGHIRKLY